MDQRYEREANGATILVLGILSWVLCGCFTGLPAWLMGNSALDDIDQGLADPSQRGIVTAGRWLGCANVVFSLVAGFFYFLAHSR